MRIATTLLLLLVIWICCASARGADAPEPEKTGTYTVAFTARSSRTMPKERALRLNQKAPPDYDLSKSDFLIVVPDSYDPTKPMGLLVLVNYKDTNDPPTPVLDLLAEKNLAFVAIKKNDMPWDQKCGATVDAVYNMQQLYKIDPARVYLFGFDYAWCGVRLMAGYSDVFCATYLCEFFDYWKQITLPNRRFKKAEVPVPPARQLGVAKSHALVISTYEPDEEQVGKSAVKAYQSEGFKNVMYVPVSHDDVHYPNYTKPWLEKVLTFFDEKREQPKSPASKPASRLAH
jgi:hypothetical protein